MLDDVELAPLAKDIEAYGLHSPIVVKDTRDPRRPESSEGLRDRRRAPALVEMGRHGEHYK